MVNEEKVKIMAQLASYEDGSGKEQMRIGKQRKKDYISARMISTWLLVSVAYFIIIGLYVFFQSELLLNNLHKMNLLLIGGLLFTGYLGMMVFFLMVAHVHYTAKYKAARKSMKPYYLNLKRLNRLYAQEAQKTNHGKALGGDL